jgi:hypothetical protein
MNSGRHALLGAAAGVLPDAALALFGWRKRWLPETHPLVVAHRFLHSPASLPVVVGLAWASHLVADRCSTHRTAPAPRQRAAIRYHRS